MALCNITGVVYLPNGALAKSRTLTFRRIDASRPTAEYLGVVLPDDVRTQTSKTGELDFDILTGNYFVHAEGAGGGFVGRSVVPDAPTAVFSDTIEEATPVIPNPAWLDQALQARDDAAQSAEEADIARDEAVASAAKVGDQAFFLSDYMHPSDFAAAKAGNIAGQDIARVTAAVQAFHLAAFQAFSGSAGNMVRVRLNYFDGAIRINDEMISEAGQQVFYDVVFAKRQGRLIFDFKNFVVYPQFTTNVAVRTSGFYAANSIAYAVPKYVFRLMKRNISDPWCADIIGNLQIEGQRNWLTDPGGVYICNMNDFEGKGRFQANNLAGEGVLIESIFNSRFDISSSSGWNPTEYGRTYGMLPTTARFSNAGAVVTSNAAVFDAADVGKAFCIADAGPLNYGGGIYMPFWATIASYQSATQVTLDAVPPRNVSNQFASFESLRGSMTAGSDVLTLSAPITGGSLVGRQVTVVGTAPLYPAGGSASAYGHLLRATIIAHTGDTCQLSLRAETAVTSTALVFNASVFIGGTDLRTIADLSAIDMISLPRLWCEDGGYGHKCGVQLVMQGYHAEITTGSKIHGASPGNGNNFGGNFSNFIASNCRDFRASMTSTHGGFSPRFGKHMFVGNRIEMDMWGTSNSYPSTNKTAEIYLMPVNYSPADVDRFRIYYGLTFPSFGGDGFSEQQFIRSNGLAVPHMVQGPGSTRENTVGGAGKLPTYLNELVVNGISVPGVQSGVEDGAAGKILLVGAFGTSGALEAPATTTPNAIFTAGHWRVNASADMPSTDSYVLEVVPRFSGQVLQRATRLSSVPTVFIRFYISGSWGAWLKTSVGRMGGTTSLRPTVALALGESFFDTTLNKPIWWNGTAWVDVAGVPV